jgi:hypothetical protein
METRTELTFYSSGTVRSMEQLFAFLATPEGTDLTRGVTILLSGLGAYFAYRAHNNTKHRNGGGGSSNGSE